MKETIPTRIVDRNGKLTTVHKRQETGAKGSTTLAGAVPSIARETPADRHTATPLAQLQPLTRDEVTRFDDKYHDILSKMATDGGPTTRDVFNHRLDGVTQAHVLKALDEGSVPAETVDQLVFSYRESLREYSPYETAMTNEEAVAKLQVSLLLARKLMNEHPTVIPTEGSTLGKLIRDAIIGYSYRARVIDRPAYTKITTEEELASLTAVMALMLEGHRQFGYSTSYFKRSVFEVSTGEDREGRYLTNRTLDKFLRENPHEVHRVIAYAQDRDIGTTAKDTAKIIEYLRESEELGAVSEGWL